MSQEGRESPVLDGSTAHHNPALGSAGAPIIILSSNHILRSVYGGYRMALGISIMFVRDKMAFLCENASKEFLP